MGGLPENLKNGKKGLKMANLGKGRTPLVFQNGLDGETLLFLGGSENGLKMRVFCKVENGGKKREFGLSRPCLADVRPSSAVEIILGSMLFLLLE